MWQRIHEGPTHITVDGTLANSYVLAAVLIVMLVIALVTIVARNSEHRVLVLAIVAIAVIATSIDGAFIYHGLSSRLAWFFGGVKMSTTYFGVPPRWPPIVAFVVGIAMSLPSFRVSKTEHRRNFWRRSERKADTIESSADQK